MKSNNTNSAIFGFTFETDYTCAQPVLYALKFSSTYMMELTSNENMGQQITQLGSSPSIGFLVKCLHVANRLAQTKGEKYFAKVLTLPGTLCNPRQICYCMLCIWDLLRLKNTHIQTIRVHDKL